MDNTNNARQMSSLLLTIFTGMSVAKWYAYLKDSIIVGKDILLKSKVGNPALFPQAFEILCRYPAQEISYTKLLGQLQGNLYYWGEKQKEVDFVYKYQGLLYAVEVKSGRRKLSQGVNIFLEKFPKAYPVIIAPENFAEFSANPRKFFDTVANK